MTVFDERELKDQLFAQNAKDVYELSLIHI